jgi:L-threonine-O-3-phosphate decarboxylase
VDFSASINPLGPPAPVIAAIGASLAQLKTYPDPSYTRLREVLAAYHQLLSDWILPGNGAAELLTWAGQDLARQETVILFVPAFQDYERALRASQAKIQLLSLSLDSEDSDTSPFKSIGGLMRGLHQNQGLLLNNPHNPTGFLFEAEALRSSLETGALVVVDEAFMDFVEMETQAAATLVPWVQEFPNLVVIRSLTKFYSLPGLRLGYAIAHPDRLRCWQQWRDPWPVNSLAALAGEVALVDRAFQAQTLAWLPPARQTLFRGLQGIAGLTPLPGVANFLLVKSDVSVSALQLALLQQFQILIRDCLSFPQLGDRFFRVAVRTEAENQQLLEALGTVMSQQQPVSTGTSVPTQNEGYPS